MLDTTTFPVTHDDLDRLVDRSFEREPDLHSDHAEILATWHARYATECRRKGLTPQPARTMTVALATLHPTDGIDNALPVVVTLIGNAQHDAATIAMAFVHEHVLAHGEAPNAVDVTVYLDGVEYLAAVTVNRESGGFRWASCATASVKAAR